MTRRTALYPGTFDPITNGHMDVIARAARLVDHLVIGVATNEAKGPLFTVEERVAMVRHEVLPIAAAAGITVSVEPFESLLMHFAEQVGATMIIRGLRAVSDFEYEFQMVGMNMQINPDIETVFLMADAQHQAIASRLVKEICALGGNIKPFVSPYVAARMDERLKPKRVPAQAKSAAAKSDGKTPARTRPRTLAAIRRVPRRGRPDRRR